MVVRICWFSPGTLQSAVVLLEVGLLLPQAHSPESTPRATRREGKETTRPRGVTRASASRGAGTA